ncbi:hypothetical protein K431DRAFT_233567 [Polychaeton citri CBS 116435]|uniref:Azaphilone pigments biosynthesis cluster protein L N-terminal domain-containing protein n=1 Tax=Polychaeton citri CBS 116435 TaxID=1314669 RepID=A0A9P4PYG7_9PEZI|nr:hypothetical protein K431DRAFT_233567 [Polychaeton citri CBS 116435]
MNSFRITTSDLGITGDALSSIASLHVLISRVNGPPRTLQDIASHLKYIQDSLDILEAIEIPNDAASDGAKETLRKTGMAGTVNECGQACSSFAQSLAKCMKQPASSNASLLERMSPSAYSQEKIRTFHTLVKTCRTTVHFAVCSTQLFVQRHADGSAEADNGKLRKQLETLEVQTEEHIELTKVQHKEVQVRKQKLQQEPDNEAGEGAQRELVIREVNEQTRLIEAVQVSLGVIYSQVQSRRTAQQIGNVTTTDESKALVGMPAEVIGKIDQRLGDVSTTKKSVALVGVYGNNMDMSGFFFTKDK